MAEGEAGDPGDLARPKSAWSRREGEAERAEREADLERAAKLRYKRHPRARTASSPSTKPPSANERRRRARPVFLKEEVDADDVAEVVARWTGIPVSRLLEGETEKLIHMEDRLHERVVGQDEAIEAVATALRRSRAGPAGPGPPDRHVPVPRPDRRRQDRAGPRAGRVHVRLTGRDDPHRHVRVHGETLRLAARRRAARLRRLRRGRPADRGRAPPSLLGGAARRDREGPRRRLQHAAAGDGRRAADRRPGPHRRLQEHRADHDLEHPSVRRAQEHGEAPRMHAARAARSTSNPSSSTASTTSCASTR